MNRKSSLGLSSLLLAASAVVLLAAPGTALAQGSYPCVGGAGTTNCPAIVPDFTTQRSVPAVVGTLASTISVPTLPGSCAAGVPVSQVTVSSKIRHTWVGDLSMTLTGPTGASVQLLSRPLSGTAPSGCSRDDIDARFVDGAAAAANTACNFTIPAIGTGDVAPVQALSAFNGLSPIGTWILTVNDNAEGGAGILEDWTLGVACGPSGPIPGVSVMAIPTGAYFPLVPANFVFSRTGATTSPLVVNYTVSGAAVAGTDYNGVPFTGSITIPAGQATASLPVSALRVPPTPVPVIVTITASAFYGIDTGSATVTILTSVPVGAYQIVPALSPFGLLALAGLIGALGVYLLGPGRPRV